MLQDDACTTKRNACEITSEHYSYKACTTGSTFSLNAWRAILRTPVIPLYQLQLPYWSVQSVHDYRHTGVENLNAAKIKLLFYIAQEVKMNGKRHCYSIQVFKTDPAVIKICAQDMLSDSNCFFS
jgi:hypothetical protein